MMAALVPKSCGNIYKRVLTRILTWIPHFVTAFTVVQDREIRISASSLTGLAIEDEFGAITIPYDHLKNLRVAEL
ncbi:Hypothetical predicted protein [Octopus vulgaris]|uniref:Uncharacterized protein n=1 Tax=Octopus vulgaris TaxID=6645 RepID=A0AA36F412_OCTVU|nr:Hypothetical predicted protein [Octopus vulgaris]